MKEVGSTCDGSYLVELSQAELTALKRLALAVEGVSAWEMQTHDHCVPEVDLSTVLGAVREYAATRAGYVA